jgi:two-component system chemotaxis response regulator CheB
VIVLDVEMPRMDGISFLRKIMAERPTPVVMCSTLTEKGAATTLQALAEGAVAFVTKPKLGLREFLRPVQRPGGQRACAAASNLRAGGHAWPQRQRQRRRRQPRATRPRPAGAMAVTTDRVVAVGNSTGGVQAIRRC